MNLVDILISVGILLFVVLGVKDGFFKKLYSIIGFMGGLVAATKLMSPTANYMMKWFDFSKEIAMVLGFAIIFLFSIVIVNLLYKWFGQSGSESISFISRIFGAVIGTFQGMIAVSLVLVMFNLFQVPDEVAKKESILYEDTYQVAPTLFNHLTSFIPDSKMFFDEIKDILESIKTH